VSDDPTRFVTLDGVHNFRDLGGLPTVAGGTTRSGRLFRSDSLHCVPEAGIGQLRDLGVVSVIDLRSHSEVEGVGRGLVGEPLRWHHVPVGSFRPGEAVPASLIAGDLGDHYLEIVQQSTAELVGLMRLLAAGTDLPAVVHCTAGKDRTGVVVALVLDLVGVEPEAIVEDYALTDARMELVMARIRGEGFHAKRLDAAHVAIERADAAFMRTFLELLDEHHDGARGWARAAGLDDDVLDRLTELLVAP
jgi:protein-tyrosine phosphatase